MQAGSLTPEVLAGYIAEQVGRRAACAGTLSKHCQSVAGGGAVRIRGRVGCAAGVLLRQLQPTSCGPGALHESTPYADPRRSCCPSAQTLVCNATAHRHITPPLPALTNPTPTPTHPIISPAPSPFQ